MATASPSTHPSATVRAAARPDPAARLEHLREVIEHACHYLPAQGPIKVFIHHNTLHAFEHLPFEEGVKEGAKLFGCQPFLSEDRYHELLSCRRITEDDLLASLSEDLGDDADRLVGFMGTRLRLRLAMLRFPLRTAPPAELRWHVAETDALRRMRSETPPEIRSAFIHQTRAWVLHERANTAGRRTSPAGSRHIHDLLGGLLSQFGESTIDGWSEATWEAFSLQALWRICRSGVHTVRLPAAHAAGVVRHRDALLAATGVDSDALVHDVLIKLCAAFLDQGFARWPLPRRDDGLFAALASLFGSEQALAELWLADLPLELMRIEQAKLRPIDSILESLDLLGVPEAEWEAYLTATLLALRGWAGMIRQVALRSDAVAHPIPPDSHLDYLAVRLLLERMALEWVARDALGYEGRLADLREAALAATPAHETAVVDQRAFQVFQLAQVLGWLPAHLASLSKQEWTTLISEIEAFPAIERRRILHAAYERHYRVQVLDAIAQHARRPAERPANPRFQVVCCLDEREESFRRHLEELAVDVETFGVAGFFNVPIYYRGAADAHYVPLCPIVVKPQHWIREEVVESLDTVHATRAKTRRALGLVLHGAHVGSRTFLGGALLTAGLGALATIPLVTRVLFPRLAARIRRLAGKMVQPPPLTYLTLERKSETPGSEGEHLGFTLEEMTRMAERLLRDIGLTSGFARLVVILGHGSFSLNNPHNSAYNCGACGGGCGGPNARAVAQILNDTRVRDELERLGIAIPAQTLFVGGWHNTCNDAVTFFDLDRLPKSHAAEFERVCREINEACDRNAHERCRRFVSAPLNMSFAAARRHVEARAEDLAQTRPECGHATNALCIVGRRSRTRGLFLDRRAFLTSYDPAQDDADNTILTRLLQAAVPVCGGINLEYFFSYIDNVGYGCGTKLPHNVTSLLGIMDGHASDLRPGLPWQMVEIHEPVRLLFIIETTPERMLRIMDRNPAIKQICMNGWVQVATLSPEGAQIHLLRQGRFEPYVVESAEELPRVAASVNWYRGQRDHLGFAVIEN